MNESWANIPCANCGHAARCHALHVAGHECYVVIGGETVMSPGTRYPEPPRPCGCFDYLPTAKTPPAACGVSAALRLVEAERLRQIEAEGYTPERDDRYDDGSLGFAAAAYATPSGVNPRLRDDLNERCPEAWPWNPMTFKPCHDDRLHELAKAGALILAEIQRVQRARGGGAE